MQFPSAPHRAADFAATLLIVWALVGSALGQTSKTAGRPVKAPGTLEINEPISGAIANGIYRNSTVGFAYKIPFGWADRTEEMSEDSGDSNAPKKSTLLLAMFEHPPEATGDGVNSAVVFAAEPASSYPGLRTAEQYFGPFTELIKSKGLKVVNEPYDYPVGAMQLVRADFSKPLGSLSMHQSTLVMMEKGYVISFTFIGGTEDEVDQLVEGLSFAKKESSTPRK